MNLPAIRVLGTGFFSPLFATAEDALANRRLTEARAPAFALVQGRLRRFTSLVTQMHLEVCGQALAAAGIGGDQVLTVFGSAVGETHTTIELLRGITDQNVASAARFAQSVHSTPSGIFSIATGNRHPSYALAAGAQTFAQALLEARLLAAERQTPVLISLADDEVPPMLGSEHPGVALAASLLIDVGEGRPLPEAATARAPHLHGSVLIPMLAALTERS